MHSTGKLATSLYFCLICLVVDKRNLFRNHSLTYLYTMYNIYIYYIATVSQFLRIFIYCKYPPFISRIKYVCIPTYNSTYDIMCYILQNSFAKFNRKFRWPYFVKVICVAMLFRTVGAHICTQKIY